MSFVSRLGQLSILAVLSCAATAASAESSNAISLIGGSLNHNGDLSSDKSSGMFGVQGTSLTPTLNPVDWLGGFALGIETDIQQSSFKVKEGTRFPFTANKDLDYSLFAISLPLCALADSPVQMCLKVGLTYIDLSQTGNRQSYAGVLGGVKIGHYLGKGLVGGIEADFTGISQEVDSKTSSFGATSYQAAVGWSY